MSIATDEDDIFKTGIQKENAWGDVHAQLKGVFIAFVIT